MKKIVFAALTAGAILSIVSCQKETLNLETSHFTGEEVRLVINATQSSTKTVLDGTTTTWKEGDKVTVMYKQTGGGSTWFSKTSGVASSSDSYATASFPVTLTSPNTLEDAYAIYPANLLFQSESDKAKITIAATQHPTASSFDGKSDILISKSFKPTGSIVTTQFSRLGATLKIKIANATLSSEKIVNLSVTGANDLAGDVLVTLSDEHASVAGIENGSETVTAEYESENQFTVGSGYYVYLVVKPQTLANGSTLTISGETENYTFSRVISLSQDIHLNAGHIVPLNITLGAEHIALKSKVFFEERFSGASGAAGWSGSVAKGDFVSDETWTVNEYVWGGSKCARIGDSDQKGQATTSAITISPALFASQDINLSFKAGAWNSASEQTIFTLSITGAKFKIGENKYESTYVEMDKGSFKEFTYEITDISSSIQISFAGKNKNNSRFFLDDVCVYYGTKPKMSAGLSYATTTLYKDLGDGFTNALSNPNSLAITYTSSDPTVATVDSEGEVTILKQGITRITATSAATSDYYAGSAYYDLIVTKFTAFSWIRTSSTDTITDGFVIARDKTSAGTTYYRENGSPGDVSHFIIYNSTTPMFTSPSVIRLTAKVGANSTGDLSSDVYACLVDGSGNAIAGTEVKITKTVSTGDGDIYEVLFAPTATANGVKLYHTIESGILVRFFELSLKFND